MKTDKTLDAQLNARLPIQNYNKLSHIMRATLPGYIMAFNAMLPQLEYSEFVMYKV